MILLIFVNQSTKRLTLKEAVDQVKNDLPE